jgi:predicted O-methyltransferase YrrM
MVKKFPSGSHFVEVGTWKGTSAAFMAVEIINSGKDIKFDCVDVWDGSNEPDYASDPKVKQNALYEHFLDNMYPVIEYVNPIRLPSVEASKLYEDNSLDFIFLDAAHDYENVYKDLIHWYPKIKSGGVFAGHDYHHDPVNKAVHDVLGSSILHIYAGCWFVNK